MSEGTIDDLMSSADSPMIVVTTSAEGERAGCLVGFHSQSSISPEHYCFWLSKANHTYRVSLRSTHFAVHFLTAEDLAVAEHFGALTGEETDKFSGLDVDTTTDGVPLLRALPNRMLVKRIVLSDDGGDHVGVTAQVVSVETTGSFTPLRLSDVGDLSPGHDSDERVIDP